MSTDEDLKAAVIDAPFGNGVDNSNMIRQAVSTTATAIQIPDAWKGSWITVKMLTSNAYLFLSEQTATLPDASKTAADKQLGWPLMAGETEHYRLPEVSSRQGHIYLCVDADASGAIVCRKSSKP